jgi:hypothetical protein
MRRQMRAMRLMVFTHRTVRAWAPLGNLETKLVVPGPTLQDPTMLLRALNERNSKISCSKPDEEPEAQENGVGT